MIPAPRTFFWAVSCRRDLMRLRSVLPSPPPAVRGVVFLTVERSPPGSRKADCLQRTMRIALDCRTLTAPKTGDRTYALNLARALAELEGPDELYYYTWESTTLLPERPRVHPVLLPAWPRWM